MNADLIRQFFPNASRSLFAANADADNPELFKPEECTGRKEKGNGAAPVRPELERHTPTGAVGEAEAEAGNHGRFLVRVTSVRKRLIDEDNLCEKYVVDCCRYAGLLHGDGPGTTTITATQRKAGKEEAEHTIVEIFAIRSAGTDSLSTGQ